MIAVARLVEQLEGRLHRVVVDLGVLVQQDLALALEFGFGEGALADDVPQHADEGLGVAREAAHVECGVVLVGVGVHVCAQALGVEIDALAVARTRALERHVLDDVADAVLARAFVLAAAAHEDADRRRGQVRQAKDDDAHAVVERRDVRTRVDSEGANSCGRVFHGGSIVHGLRCAAIAQRRNESLIGGSFSPYRQASVECESEQFSLRFQGY